MKISRVRNKSHKSLFFLKTSIYLFIFSFIIFVWAIFALMSIFYNAQKTVTEVKEWVNLTDHQKRYKIFGDLYIFFLQVNTYTEPNAKILIHSNDGMTSGIGRYYIYPRVLTWPRREDEFKKLVATKNYPYLFSYNGIMTINHYEQIASFSSKTTGNYGILYKIK